MAAIIQTKRCSHCKQIKPLSEFNKYTSGKFGCHNQCKICKSGTQNRYNSTVKGKATLKRYRQSEKGKVVGKRYNTSAKGKKHRRELLIKFYQKNPLQYIAIQAIRAAVYIGKLPRPDTLQCSCGEHAQQYHHWHGYEPGHHLDVIPVCIPCHFKLRLTS